MAAWRLAIDTRCDPRHTQSSGTLITGILINSLEFRPTEVTMFKTRLAVLAAAGVLGLALCHVAGLTFEQLLWERIAQPLGLQDTAIAPPHDTERVAVGHSRRRRPVADWAFPGLAGAGALRSTVSDLLRFLDAHIHPLDSPLPVPVGLVREPRVEAGSHLRVALGWHVLDRRGRTPVWWHNGGTGGFFSFVGFDPVADVAVVVLSNTARSVDRIGGALLHRLSRPSFVRRDSTHRRASRQPRMS
jgi:CubicO group peptidase (beta-lactamase class C family)